MALKDYPDLAKLSAAQKLELSEELKADARKSPKFIFGVDLDGVVMDFYGGLKPIAAEWLGRKPEELSDDYRFGLKAWGLMDKAGGYDLSYDALHRFAITQHELFRNAPVIPGAAYHLRRLSRLSVHIRIITHRLYVGGLHGPTVAQTAEWLERHDIPYRDLCFVADKTSINAHLYIDDSPKNIRAFSDAGRPCIVFSNPTNRELQVPLRAENWEDVYELVRRTMRQEGFEVNDDSV